MKSEKRQILDTFIRYVTLNVLGMIGLSCYILADTFFVSKGLGTTGLTALNLAIPIYSFINGLGLMIGMGGATQYSLFRTSGQKEFGNTVFSQSIMFAFVASIILMFIGIFGASSLTSLLGANAEVFENTKTYLRVILIFAPMFIMNNVVLCFVRNDGNPKLSMIAMLIGSFSNVVLDYVFIFTFEMGMFGAVFATGLAPIISLAILSLHFIKRQNKFKFIKIKLSLKSCFDISSFGVSFLITEISAGIVMIIFNMIILKLKGNVGVAAYGVVANLSLVATSIFTGISQGIQPIISRAYGMKEMKTIRKTYQYALTTALTIAAGIYILISTFTEPIVNIFNKEHNLEFLEIASSGMYIYFTAFIFLGFNIITAVRFNSMDDPKKSFIISLLRGFVFIIPFTFILSNLFQMTGVWLAFPITELTTAVVCIILLFHKKRFHYNNKRIK